MIMIYRIKVIGMIYTEEGFANNEAFLIAQLSESGLKDFRICKISPRAILFNHPNPTNHGSVNLKEGFA